MTTMDDLKARARPTPVSRSCGDLQLTLERARGATPVIDALSAYFGADETRQEARVIVDGEVVGYVSREDAYELVELKSKGIGRPGRREAFEARELRAGHLPGDPTMREEP